MPWYCEFTAGDVNVVRASLIFLFAIGGIVGFTFAWIVRGRQLRQVPSDYRH